MNAANCLSPLLLVLAACTGGGPGAGAGSGPCGDAMPADLDVTYQMQPLAGSAMVGTWTVSFEGTPDAFVQRTEADDFTAESDLYCDGEGVWQVADRYDGFGSNETVLDEPALLFPAALEVGTVWLRRFEGVTTDDAGVEIPLLLEQSVEITQADSITVPAGTYDGALRLEIDLYPGRPPQGWWLAPGVGIVLQEGFGELVDIVR